MPKEPQAYQGITKESYFLKASNEKPHDFQSFVILFRTAFIDTTRTEDLRLCLESFENCHKSKKRCLIKMKRVLLGVWEVNWDLSDKQVFRETKRLWWYVQTSEVVKLQQHMEMENCKFEILLFRFKSLCEITRSRLMNRIVNFCIPTFRSNLRLKEFEGSDALPLKFLAEIRIRRLPLKRQHKCAQRDKID